MLLKGGRTAVSFAKAIASGKEHRKEYRGSQRIDTSCRCHGRCEYCRSNRLHQYHKQEEKQRLRLEEFWKNGKGGEKWDEN